MGAIARPTLRNVDLDSRAKLPTLFAHHAGSGFASAGIQGLICINPQPIAGSRTSQRTVLFASMNTVAPNFANSIAKPVANTSMVYPALTPRLKMRRAFWWTVYEAVSLAGAFSRRSSPFLNYGYEYEKDLLPLNAADEPHRLSIGLYRRTLSNVGIDGKKLVEVGCGRGGGCHYVASYFSPAHVLGLDLAPSAVRHARRRFGSDRVQFHTADATRLPIADGSFDVVLNVESSHCYPSVPRFLGEAARILKPGGTLLLADMRSEPLVAELRDQILGAGFAIQEEEDITSNVVEAREAVSEHEWEEIRTMPIPFKRQVRTFAGLRGSETFSKLATREIRYLRWVATRS